MTNIVLVGLSGSGKSAIGKCLAARLGKGFIDLDELIEAKEKNTIKEIISKKGLEYFRQSEFDSLNKLVALKNHVLSLGGGASCSDEAQEQIANIGVQIWINPSLEIIGKRLVNNKSERNKRIHLFAELNSFVDKPILSEICKCLSSLLEKRRRFYEKACLQISDDYNGVESIAERIKEHLHGQTH